MYGVCTVMLANVVKLLMQSTANARLSVIVWEAVERFWRISIFARIHTHRTHVHATRTTFCERSHANHVDIERTLAPTKNKGGGRSLRVRTHT